MQTLKKGSAKYMINIQFLSYLSYINMYSNILIYVVRRKSLTIIHNLNIFIILNMDGSL